MKKLISAIILSILSTSVNADDQQTFVFNNLQGDFTTCYSYYLLSEEGLKKSGSANDETISGLNKSADLSLESVFMIGQQLGMNTDTMRNRVKTSFESIKNEMGEDYKNFSKVLDKYGIFCKDCLLYTSPSPRDLSTSRMPSSA